MSYSTLALPAPDQGWILYSGGSEIGRGVDLGELVGNRGDLLVAIPASNVSTFVVELPPVEEALHGAMIHAQVDKRGLDGKGTALVDYERIATSEAGDTFVVRAVPELHADAVVRHAKGYTTSALLRSSSTATATIWREWGRFVLSVRVGAIPVHVQVLSGKPEVGVALAREVNLILLGLRSGSDLESSGPMSLALALDEVDSAEFKAFQEVLSIPARIESPSVPARGEGRVRLLPHQVALHRRRRRGMLRNLALAAVALVIYTVIGMWLWKSAKMTKQEIAALEQRLAIIQPDVERVQLAEQRWRSLEPAFNKDLFPIIQLSRITAALPGSGVVIREYRTTGREIRVRGQARDVQLANRLLEDLQGMEGFGSYEWSMPNPKVERNNTATFEIQGKSKHEGVDG